MVLDIAEFRAEDGGDPAKMTKLQTDRFKVFYLKSLNIFFSANFAYFLPNFG